MDEYNSIRTLMLSADKDCWCFLYRSVVTYDQNTKSCRQDELARLCHASEKIKMVKQGIETKTNSIFQGK